MSSEYLTHLKISIPSYKESTIDRNVIFYSISVQRGSEQWNLEKRFSEFSDLHKNLSKLFKNLPSFPSKTLTKQTDMHFLQTRQRTLEAYLIACAERLEVFSSEPIKKFLQLDTFSPETSIHAPRLLQTLGPMPQGLRDFTFVNQTCLFVLNSEMSLTTRVDSYLTNLKMPWEKEEPPVIMSVAAVDCFVESNGKYEKLWSKSFKCQAICLFWEPKSEILYVGMDDGHVVGLKVASEYKFYKQEEVFNKLMHKGRVMQVYVRDDMLVSVGSDGRLRIVSLSRNDTIVEEQPSGQALNDMIIYENRMFVATVGGKLIVYAFNNGNITRKFDI